MKQSPLPPKGEAIKELLSSPLRGVGGLLLLALFSPLYDIGGLHAQYLGGNADGHALVSKTDVAVCTLPSYSNISTGGSSDGHALVSKTDVAVCTLPQYSSISKGGNADGHALVNSACLSVTAVPKVLTVTASSTTLTCNGQCTAAATASANGNPPYTYSWNSSPVQITATATGLCAGTYTVLVTDANGSSTAMVTITEPAALPVTITATPNTIVVGDSTQITASGGDTYLWTPTTGLSDSTISNPVAKPLQTTAYCVTVTDTSTGCSNNACITITLLQETCEPYIPNAFSPNVDGENDFLRVHGDCIKELSFSIYDRWGEKVFETIDLSIAMTKGWDGVYKGKLLNTGVFVYYFTASLNDGTPLELTGNISLIR